MDRISPAHLLIVPNGGELDGSILAQLMMCSTHCVSYQSACLLNLPLR